MAVADEELTESDRDAITAVNDMPEADPPGEKSLEQMAEDGDGEEQMTLLDFGDTLSVTLRGKKPNESKIKIRALQREIKGQLGDKGDDEEVFVLVRASLDEVQMKSFRDDNRRIRSKRRLHILEPVGVVRLPEDVAEGLFDQFA